MQFFLYEMVARTIAAYLYFDTYRTIHRGLIDGRYVPLWTHAKLNQRGQVVQPRKGPLRRRKAFAFEHRTHIQPTPFVTATQKSG
jgi:hypothetical protein